MTGVFIEVGEKQENVSHDGKDASREGRLGLGDFPHRQERSPSPSPQLADIHPLTLKEAAEHHQGLWFPRKFLSCSVVTQASVRRAIWT